MPRWRKLLEVLSHSRGAYAQWVLANFGGMIVAYAASLTIWVFHRSLGNLLPGPEVYLITATISLALTGVSYLSLPPSGSVTPLPALSFTWAFLLAAVYGVLIAMGVKTPVIHNDIIWVIVIAIAVACWLWASITWLHERGIRGELEGPPPPPPEPSPILRRAAEELPKIPAQGPPPGEG